MNISQEESTTENLEFDITLFTADKTPMTKTFGIEKGELVKQRPGLIALGQYQVRKTTLYKLAKGLGSLSKYQALGLGTPKQNKGQLTTAQKHLGLCSPNDPIPRTSEYFRFKRKPTAILFDFDGINLLVKAALEVLMGIIPGFDKAEKLIVHSSSSGLYLEGELLKETTSAHVYVVVSDGTHIPSFMRTLSQRLWLAGYGHIQISAAGSLLIRSLNDGSVGSPERIIYEAAPILMDGLVQKRPSPEYIPGELLDLSLIPDLCRDEEQQYKDLVAAAKAKIRPDADKIRKIYDRLQVKTLVSSGIAETEAHKAIAGRHKGALTLNDILYLSKDKVLAVRDISQDHHGQSCCDPLEPSYNDWHDTVAKIYVNEDGSIVINSNAHGGQVYHVSNITKEHYSTPQVALFNEDGKPKTKVTVLIEIGSRFDLFHDETGEGYASIEKDGHKETWPIKSKVFKELLADEYYLLSNIGVSGRVIDDALDTLRGKARVDGEQQRVHRRTAEHKGNLYLDLGDKDWSVVEISREGWRVKRTSPVKFLRSPSNQDLPRPEKGGSLEELWALLNIRPEDRALIAGFLVRALCPNGPYLGLCINGEQGTAKSTGTKIIRSFCDPSTAMLRPPPKDERDFLAGAINNWCITYDNLSGMQPWLSDALCRVLTGGAFAARTLYSNTEETTIPLARPAILNGIDDLANRPDLADRVVTINFQPIQEGTRRDERELWRQFDQEKGKIFGVLLDGLTAALNNVDNVTLHYKPRMIDAAKWATAAEEGLGLASGSFIDSYRKNQRDMVAMSLDSSPFIAALLDMIQEKREWEGTPTELLLLLPAYARDEDTVRSKAWPKSASWVTKFLKRYAPALRKIDVGFEQQRISASSRIKITVHPTEAYF